MTFKRLIVGRSVRNSWCYSLGETLTLLWVICTSKNPTGTHPREIPCSIGRESGRLIIVIRLRACSLKKTYFPGENTLPEPYLTRGRTFLSFQTPPVFLFNLLRWGKLEELLVKVIAQRHRPTKRLRFNCIITEHFLSPILYPKSCQRQD